MKSGTAESSVQCGERASGVMSAGAADKTLIYLELCVGQFMKRFESCKTKAEAYKLVHAVVLEPFLMPGDAGFALGGFVQAPTSRSEAGAPLAASLPQKPRVLLLSRFEGCGIFSAKSRVMLLNAGTLLQRPRFAPDPGVAAEGSQGSGRDRELARVLQTSEGGAGLAFVGEVLHGGYGVAKQILDGLLQPQVSQQAAVRLKEVVVFL
jgi:hypothetical protein